jgi:hypothetical protein
MSTRNYEIQSIYLVPERARALKALSRVSRIPRAALMREAIDLLLAKYGLPVNTEPHSEILMGVAPVVSSDMPDDEDAA